MEDDHGGAVVASASSSLLSSLGPLLLRLATLVLGLVGFAGSVLYVKQESLLYFPEIGGIPRRPDGNPRGYRSPDERALPYESHMIPCADGVHIHAWLLFAFDTPKTAPTIIFFHGNAGNIGLRLPNALQMLQHLRVNVLMVEYRGYGNSDSVTPTEAGLKLDAEAALRFVHQELGQARGVIDSSQIFLFGRSLGGSVAFHLAEHAVMQQQQPNKNGQQEQLPMIAGLIVENTFTSISAMVDKLMPFLTPIKPFVLKIGWNSAAIVPKLHGVPILFLAGARDELVPHDHMRELVQLAEASGNAMVSMHVIPDGTHNESWIQGGPAYWDAIKNFMAGVLQNKMATTQQPLAAATAAAASTSTTSSSGGGSKGDVKSSIPIMSSNFMDIAKEAVGVGHAGAGNNTNSVDQKKEL